MRLLKPLAMAATMALSVLAPSASQAAVQLCFDNAAGGFNMGTASCINDGGPGDAAAGVPNAIAYFQSFLGFTLVGGLAFGEPLFIPGFGFDLSASGSGSGSIIVAFSQNDLSFGGPGVNLTSIAAEFTGSASNGTGSYQLYADDSNQLFGQGQLISQGGFNTAGGSTALLSNPFSLSGFITLTAAPGGSSFSSDLMVEVPEPASLALVGIAFVGLGVASRGRRSKAA